ncbi:hypothetical protein [Streptosporangium sp. NPDC003464]
MDIDFEVHGPPELVDRIRALSAHLATAAPPDPTPRRRAGR